MIILQAKHNPVTLYNLLMLITTMYLHNVYKEIIKEGIL